MQEKNVEEIQNAGADADADVETYIATVRLVRLVPKLAVTTLLCFPSNRETFLTMLANPANSARLLDTVRFGWQIRCDEANGPSMKMPSKFGSVAV